MAVKKVLKKIIKNGVEYEIPSGSQIIIDSALSDSSENPVQNKVIKGVLDLKLEMKNDTITSSTVLSNLTPGIYIINGITHPGFPNPNTTYYGILIQYNGDYKPQMLIAGPAGNTPAKVYTRRRLTGSASWNSRTESVSKTELDTKITNPSGGTAGQVLTKTANGETWADASGGGVDTETVNSIIDLKLKDYDSIFQITDGLYKILNDIDEEDELGLTGGNSWSDIVSTEASMNKISHSRAVMTMIASSEEALTTAINDSGALNELLSAWNSVENLRSSELARNIMLNDEEVVLAILDNPVAFDGYFLDKEYCKIILANKSYSVSFWGEVIDNDDFMDYLYANNDLFGVFLNNNKAFTAYKNSDYWDEALNDYSRFTIIMEEAGSKVMKTTSSEQLSQDIPLRAIISSGRLDEFLEKDERAYNGVICFDIDFKNASYKSFNIAKYGYNGVQSNWKISVDGGAWTTYNATCNTSPISISVSNIGRHLIVIKPETYGVGWARQMGNRSSSNYWTSNTNIAWTIKNLPIFAFMNSLTETTNNILYYAFYGTYSLVKIESIKGPSEGPANTGTYFMADAFYSCPYLESIEGGNFLGSCYTAIGNSFLLSAFYYCTNLLYCRASIKSSSITSVGSTLLQQGFLSCSKILETIPIELPECLTLGDQFMNQCYQSDTTLQKANKIIFGKLTTIGTYFMANAFYGCNQLRNMPKGLNLETVTTIGAYFLQQTWYSCSNLLGCNPEFQMPTGYNSTNYCYYAWYYCSKLNTSAPNKSIRFRGSGSSTFTSSGTGYGNVGDGNYTLHTYSEE